MSSNLIDTEFILVLFFIKKYEYYYAVELFFLVSTICKYAPLVIMLKELYE